MSFFKKNLDITAGAILFTLLFFMIFSFAPKAGIPFISEAWALQSTTTATLSVTIASNLTFTIDSATVAFGTLTPGTPKIATTTLSVATNNASGWIVTLYGNDQSSSDNVMDLTTDASVNITDDTEWTQGSATTSAGTATNITEGDDQLSFRVMSASGTVSFRASSWWGTSDTNYNASQLWAGFASSTINQQIGNSSVWSKTPAGADGTALNTVQYYLDVPSTQRSGSYDGVITYAAATNP